jgi:hypothetical protein
VSDHEIYAPAERVVTAMDRDGLTLRVYEKSRTVCTEAVLSQDEAHRLAQRLVNWSLRHGPWTLANDEPDGPEVPEFWPPKPGELWRDCENELYAVTKGGRLIPLYVVGESPAPYWSADDFLAKLGPARRVAISPDGDDPWDEVPF